MGDTFIVYKHTTPSNKVYIGITSQQKEKRWAYGFGYKENKYFYRAIKKYGWNNIKHEILYEHLTKEQAIHKEIDLIKKYDSMNHEKGYNLTKGGDGNFGVKFTEERKRNISKAKIGHKVSEETKQKIREKISGENHWNYGKHLKEETKKKISKARKGVKFTEEHKKHMCLWEKGHIPWNKNKKLSKETIDKIIATRKCKTVLCVETNMEYESIRKAGRETNINHAHIAEVCKGIRKTAGHYHWQYVGGV